MLVIRMQRVGRKKLAQYRIVVQDSRSAPTSGRVVASLGNYNPHTKEANLRVEDIEKFLSNGAQPSDRVVRLLAANKVELPKWVKLPSNSATRSTRNPEKLRKNQPKEESSEEVTPSEGESTTDNAVAEEAAPVEA